MSIDISRLDMDWLEAGNPDGEFPDARFNEFLSSMAKLFRESVPTASLAAVCAGEPEEVVKTRFQMGAALAYLALMYGFTWDKTEEDFEFWDGVSNHLERIAKEGK